MGEVIDLADFMITRDALDGPVCGVDRLCGHVTFTARDHEDLDGWVHAGVRVAVNFSDMGAYVTLHRRTVPWALWGLVRQGRSILLWDCVTLADIGRFPSMIDALAAVPVENPIAPVPNVLWFAALN